MWPEACADGWAHVRRAGRQGLRLPLAPAFFAFWVTFFLPHILPPSPLFFPPKLDFHNKCGLSFQFPQHWLVGDTSEGDRNISAQDECVVHTTQGSRSWRGPSPGQQWEEMSDFLGLFTRCPKREPCSLPPTCTLSSKLPGTFPGFLAGSVISTRGPDLSSPLLI